MIINCDVSETGNDIRCRYTYSCVLTKMWVFPTTIIASDNGLSPAQRQTIIWTNAGILVIGPLGINFSKILIAIQTFSFKKMHLKISCAKKRLFRLGLNVLINYVIIGSDNGQTYKLLPEPMLQLDPYKQISVQGLFKMQWFSLKKNYLELLSVKRWPFHLGLSLLTHWGRVTHICVGNLTTIGSPSHYLNQCWNIVNWTPRKKLHWNDNRNSYIFIQENPLENVVWKMAAFLSRPQWVKL